jgi:type III secretion system YscI/HrpB-like protein
MGGLAIAAQLASTIPAVPEVHASVGSTQSAAARFTDLLSAGNVASTPAANAAAGAVVAVQPSGTATLGDAILKKLSGIGENYRANLKEATDAIAMPSHMLGMSDLLHIQMSMAQVTLDVELISKGVAKVSQHIDTLTKLQ